MGGCCCSSRSAALSRTPDYYLCPQVLAEHAPLSSSRDTSSSVSIGLLLDSNLVTSSPDTYRAPPAPLPYDVDSHRVVEADGNFESSDVPDALKKADCKTKTDSGLDSPKVMDDEPSKLNKPITSATDEEDVCPTCLEEYDAENPRIITKCEHHFHLSCILEWMERSDTCPICDQIMMIDHEYAE